MSTADPTTTTATTSAVTTQVTATAMEARVTTMLLLPARITSACDHCDVASK